PILHQLPALDQGIVARALDVDPAKRWPSSTDMVLALEGMRTDVNDNDGDTEDPFVQLVRLPRTVPPNLIRDATPGDLRRFIADIIKGVGGKAEPEAEEAPILSTEGDRVMHKVRVALPLGAARLRLESFTARWLGQYVQDDENGPVIRIDVPASRWQRWRGNTPSLEIAFRLDRLRARLATPIEVAVEVHVHGCAHATGRRILE